MYGQAGMNPQLLALLLQAQAAQQPPSLAPQLPQSQPRNAYAGGGMAPMIAPQPPGGAAGAASPMGQLLNSPVLAQLLKSRQWPGAAQGGGSTSNPYGILGQLFGWGQTQGFDAPSLTALNYASGANPMGLPGIGAGGY